MTVSDVFKRLPAGVRQFERCLEIRTERQAPYRSFLVHALARLGGLFQRTVRRGSLAIATASLFYCGSLNAQEEDKPSEDFLEYLAMLVDQDGEWIDPLELDELPEDDANLVQIRQDSDDDETAEETP